MNFNTIDLGRAEKAVSSLVADDQQQQQQGYQPKTLQSHNDARKLYLPIFPTVAFGPNDRLLLTNVPVAQLGALEMTRRQHGAYTSDALLLMKDYNFYNTRGLALSQQDIEELTTRLRVGPSIITFNAEQLRGHIHSFGSLHETFQENILEKTRITVKNGLPFTSKQMALALEFYLQMDVDVFYMKTCSFRGAEPPSNFEGLFCGTNEPEGRYTLTACGEQLCSCCYPINHGKKNQPWSVVDFHSSSGHRFVNGYTTYLNCPATCKTTNLIYVMTCPCGRYDYIDSTAQTLAHAMAYHRKHGNRIIHERLVGTRLFRGMELDPSEREKDIANKMRLYQHSARCPVALRSFLDCNPNYWCFIPLLWVDAVTENIIHLQRVPRQQRVEMSASNADPELYNIIAMGAMGNDRVARYLENLPLPPAKYGFSYRQRQQQRAFFEHFLSAPLQQLPDSPIDLYQVAIVAILPEDCSAFLRYIIETLFVTHGETKLNMICPIGGDPERYYGRPYNILWCAHLTHPAIPSPPPPQQRTNQHNTQN